jgi:hypothetical protein
MTTPRPIEVTTRYATSVNELADAWAFVMDRLDRVGPDPSVTIKPIWTISVRDMDTDDEDQEWPRRFEVVVEGMVHEGGSDG